MKQLAIFSDEQAKGTGQESMLTLIEQNEARIEELRTLPHTFWEDPGHAWLEVEYSDLIILGITGLISSCSYRNGTKVYLEEDYDAETYLRALFGDLKENEDFNAFKNYVRLVHEENIFIRNLRRY